MTTSSPFSHRRWLSFAIVGSLFAAVPLPAATPAVREAVKARVDAEYPSLEAIYRDIHQHPELSFMETRTAAKALSDLLGIRPDFGTIAGRRSASGSVPIRSWSSISSTVCARQGSR
jgi:hypothetical protein